MSLRARLLRTSLLTLAIGLGALLVAGNVLLQVRIDHEASGELRARADAQLAALNVTPRAIEVRESPNDAVLDQRSWVLERGRVLERPAGVSAALDRAAVALGRSPRGGDRDGPGDVRLHAAPAVAPGARRPTGAVVVGLSIERFERLQQEVLLGSLVLAALVLVAGWIAIRSALDGALRPVAQMTADAGSWGAHDLDRRFGLGTPRDELTGLAATLDGLLGRIAASRRHEQHFASEIAHELRTPVAGLRARAELALASGDAAERDAALRTVLDQTGRLQRAIDALLAVARRELDPATGTVDVAAVARAVDGVEVRGGDGDLPAAGGDAEVVGRALAALVENARRHGGGTVRLELGSGDGRVRIAVRDDGPGLDAALGETAFDPGVRGPAAPDGGAGLGLPLARRLARSCGGDVVVGAGPGGCFVLELPAV
jgi:signal transduction histidine kinase